nr:MAG TPA: hypothetical protein [Caudoviricetes sp.]
MAIKDTKKDLKLGMTVAEAVKNADDNFTTLFDNDDDLQTQINGKEPTITKKSAFNKDFATTNPVMDGTASPGTADTVARGDHVHPTDTSRLAAAPDGTNSLLDTNNKVRAIYLPDEVLGQLSYQGTWDASTSTGAPATTKQKGDYYVCSKGGRYNPDGTQIASGVQAFAVGDWAVYNGTSWDKVDNTDAVTMVNGQIGSVQTYKGEYSNSTTYHKGDIVLGTDSCLYLYINNLAASGHATSETTHWKIFGKVYDNATQTAAGLMSAADKKKLDGYTVANSDLEDAVEKKHTHTNKKILDDTTASYTTAEKTKLGQIDDSLLNKTFDEFGKVKDVKLDGTSVVDTATGIANLKSAYHVTIPEDTLTITEAQYNALVADDNSYVIYKGQIYRHISSPVKTTDVSAVFGKASGTVIGTISIRTGTYACTVSSHELEQVANKSTAIDATSDTKYPTTKAVAEHVSTIKNEIEGDIKVTDVQKPDGTTIVTNKIAKLPSISVTKKFTRESITSNSWKQLTINGQVCYGLAVDSTFEALVNNNGDAVLCQLHLDTTSNTLYACIAAKANVTIVSSTIAYK